MDKTAIDEIIKRLDNIEKKLDFSKKMLTVDDVANYTGISKSNIYKLTSAGKIPHYKPTGKRLYFDLEEINEWLKSNRVGGDEGDR